ncbi:MAG: response regulator, partial [Myxococcales bacterium]
MSILLVDDRPESLLALEASLLDLDVVLVCATSAAQAAEWSTGADVAAAVIG